MLGVVTEATKRLVVAGATGLVGRALLDALARRGDSAVALVRRPVDDLSAELLVREDLMNPGPLPPHDTVLLALGTTRKVAGSLEAQEKVDRHMMVAVAKAAREAGARRVGIISSHGADAESSLPYLRMKGQMEAEILALGFERCVIARPGILDGPREALDQPMRLGEALALGMMRPFSALLPKSVRPVRVTDVAAGLLEALEARGSGEQILSSAELQGAAKRQAQPV